MKTVLGILILICALNSFAQITPSENNAKVITTPYPSNMQVLWITGDVAEQIYEALKNKPQYTVEEIRDEDRPTVGALELVNRNNLFSDWLCIVMTDKVKPEVRIGMDKYRCRIVIDLGDTPSTP